MADYLADIPGPFIKSVSINNLPEEAWRVISGPTAGGGYQQYYRGVWAIYRGIMLRTNALSAMPFTILKGEAVYDTSDSYANKVGFLPNPARFLAQMEAALCIWGASYHERGRNVVGKPKDMFYMLPPSVTPKIDDSGNLLEFERATKSGKKTMATDELLYVWYTDPYVEVGAPQSSPVMAAAAAAGVLLSVDKFATAFFNRGAIQTTILTVKGSWVKDEISKLKSWWGSVTQGSKSAWSSTVVNGDQIVPVIVGQGLESLENTELTNEKREAIATALGIPHSMLFSVSAKGLGGGGVATQDEANFYKQTIVPECRLIEGFLNEQLFTPLGLRFEFNEENLDVYQEDEASRAAAVSSFIDFLTKCPTAEIALETANTFGYELSDKMIAAIEKYFSDKEAKAEEMQANMEAAQNNPPQNEPGKEDAEQQRPPMQDEGEGPVTQEMRAYRRKALKAVKAGKPADVKFDSAVLSPALSGALSGQLAGAHTAEDVNRIFDSVWIGYP